MSITRKPSFVVGWDEGAKLAFSFTTDDAGEAKQVYSDILNGVHAEAKSKGVFYVQLFLKPNWDRRRDVPVKPKPKAEKSEPAKRRGRPPKAKAEQTGDAFSPSATDPVLSP